MVVLCGHLMMTTRWWMFWVVCHVTNGCPVWVSNDGCTYGRRYGPADLSWPSCHGFSVMVFLSRLSSGHLMVAVLWRLFCPGLSVLEAVLGSFPGEVVSSFFLPARESIQSPN
jgi:hypothetical protein